MSKKTIILYGHLAKKYPHKIEVEAASVAEAIRSLSTIEELTPPDGRPWPVTVRGVTNEIALYSDTDLEEIHVFPQTGGAKRGGFLQVLLGIAIVALAFLVGPAGWLGLSQGAMFLTGGLMALGGVLQLLLPTPQGVDNNPQEASKYLGASANTVKIGTRIPLAYGNNRLGGHYLSFDVDAFDQGTSADSEVGAGTLATFPIAVNSFSYNGNPEAPVVTVEEEIVTSGVYVEFDKTTVPMTPINPVFSGSVTSPSNVPVSGWL